MVMCCTLCQIEVFLSFVHFVVMVRVSRVGGKTLLPYQISYTTILMLSFKCNTLIKSNHNKLPNSHLLIWYGGNVFGFTGLAIIKVSVKVGNWVA